MNCFENRILIPGEDYPRNYRELGSMFKDEEKCIDYLSKIRWPNGFECPKCKKISNNIKRDNRNRYVCAYCRHQTTVTTGTIFEKTRTPLGIWFEIIWYLTSTIYGVSAKAIQEITSLSYRSSWMLLQRIRSAMWHQEDEKLEGEVEIGLISIDDFTMQIREEHVSSNILIVMAVELANSNNNKKEYRRVRFCILPNLDFNELKNFFQNSIASGSYIFPDFRPIEGEKRHTFDVNSLKELKFFLPGSDYITALFKMWISSTYGNFLPTDHLHLYLNEFTFRFNHRYYPRKGCVFRKLLKQCLQTKPTVLTL